MTLWQAAVLGIVQGLTEFLPVSSSAHLALFPWIFGWRDPGLAFDVALHWGTLLAVGIYFYRDWLALAGGVLRAARERRGNADAGLAAKLVVGSLPAAAAGLLLEDAAEGALRSPWIIAAMLAAVALLLWALDRRPRTGPTGIVPGWGSVLLIGAAQAVALVPGTSRSGITMAAGLLVGLPRPAAARFSFLLSAPIILGAGVHQIKDFAQGPPLALAVGLVASALAGGAAIGFLLRYLARGSFAPFAVYRLLLAGLVVGLLIARPA
jgi:undecaprenyl-diphosphatase